MTYLLTHRGYLLHFAGTGPSVGTVRPLTPLFPEFDLLQYGEREETPVHNTLLATLPGELGFMILRHLFLLYLRGHAFDKAASLATCLSVGFSLDVYLRFIRSDRDHAHRLSASVRCARITRTLRLLMILFDDYLNEPLRHFMSHTTQQGYFLPELPHLTMIADPFNQPHLLAQDDITVGSALFVPPPFLCVRYDGNVTFRINVLPTKRLCLYTGPAQLGSDLAVHRTLPGSRVLPPLFGSGFQVERGSILRPLFHLTVLTLEPSAPYLSEAFRVYHDTMEVPPEGWTLRLRGPFAFHKDTDPYWSAFSHLLNIAFGPRTWLYLHANPYSYLGL